VSESAESAKRGWGKFGAKPAQSETAVRAAAKRRSTRQRTEWKEDVKRPLRFYRSIQSRAPAEYAGAVIIAFFSLTEPEHPLGD
jgi:hypothetical protein